MSLAELDRWDPNAIATVMSAVVDHSDATRQSSHGLGQIMNSVPWEGAAYDAAAAAASGIQKDLDLHAEQLDAVANAAKLAEAEVRGIKSDWQKICRMADRWGIEIDIDTNSIVPPSPAPTDPDDIAELERRMDILHDEIVALLVRAANADRDLAAAINGATGALSPAAVNRELQDEPSTNLAGGPSDDGRRKNQMDAFRQVFGRDPVTAGDWTTAAALDPHSYDAKNQGTPANIAVGRIQPVPGKGVIRTNLFIPGRAAWSPKLGMPPYDDNLGDNRGFSSAAGPEESRVAIYVDYDNGLIVARQNPSVNEDSGVVRVGTPQVSAVQQSNGSVLVRYAAADPFGPGGENLAKAAGVNVNGTLAFDPTGTGVNVGGTVTNFPALEIYQDHPDGSTSTLLHSWPEFFDNAGGPLAGLWWHRDVGDASLPYSFNDVAPAPHVPTLPDTRTPAPPLGLPPMAATPPPTTSLGQVNSVPTVRIDDPMVTLPAPLPR